MKKLSVFFIITAAFFACNNSDEKPTDTEAEPKKNIAMTNPDYDAGLELVAKSDCFTCHKLRESSVGPSYGEVAKKYPNTTENISLLAERIIKGGQNVWGPTPMMPHPALSKTDAETMVKYILLLNE